MKDVLCGSDMAETNDNCDRCRISLSDSLDNTSIFQHSGRSINPKLVAETPNYSIASAFTAPISTMFRSWLKLIN